MSHLVREVEDDRASGHDPGLERVDHEVDELRPVHLALLLGHGRVDRADLLPADAEHAVEAKVTVLDARKQPALPGGLREERHCFRERKPAFPCGKYLEVTLHVEFEPFVAFGHAPLVKPVQRPRRVGSARCYWKWLLHPGRGQGVNGRAPSRPDEISTIPLSSGGVGQSTQKPHSHAWPIVVQSSVTAPVASRVSM